ncbi:hypothetical protein IFM89_028702 [Coptis chinensis]|uniref:non-specific serine/threonine protein kinase n=1 Tax=Coptis chinensis TaxID=261450 RepID=A0A835I8L4_9MAGN|nr:hypothetical protein IFM89_028702 [Coptis chinensis]
MFRVGTGNKSRKRIVISTSLAAILATALFCLFLYCRWGRKQRGKRTRQAYEDDQKFGANEMETKIMVDYQYDDISAEDQMNPQELPLVPLSVIKVATNNFADANKLGQGGFGQVYKATLNEKEIAVKRLLTTSTQGLEEFKNEVILIAKLQHRNLVRLLGCCIEEEEKLLIYEYMPNTSLDMFLFGNSIVSSDFCNFMSVFIIFCFCSGYMAPEYAMQGLFSVKSDVYSFGVLLLEIISGKRNNNEFYQSEHAQSLLAYAWRLWCDGRGLEFIDSLMGVSCDLNEVLKCMHIGLLCVQEDAADRPTMSTVVVMFASYTITLPGPTQPAFSVGRLVTESSKFSETSTSGSTNEITVSEVLAR